MLCLISNTLPQLEPSSLHSSTVLHHRHLQTTCYNHLLLLLLLLHLISREENLSSNKLGPPPPTTPTLSRGVVKSEGPSALQLQNTSLWKNTWISFRNSILHLYFVHFLFQVDIMDRNVYLLVSMGVSSAFG